jgi:hypothetical protein
VAILGGGGGFFTLGFEFWIDLAEALHIDIVLYLIVIPCKRGCGEFYALGETSIPRSEIGFLDW